jgi:hypothetical protein
MKSVVADFTARAHRQEGAPSSPDGTRVQPIGSTVLLVKCRYWFARVKFGTEGRRVSARGEVFPSSAVMAAE